MHEDSSFKSTKKKFQITHAEMYIHLPSGIYLLDRIYKGDEVDRNTIERLALGNHALYTKNVNILAFCLDYPLVEISCLFRSHTRRHLARIGVCGHSRFEIDWQTRNLALRAPVVQAAGYPIPPE